MRYSTEQCVEFKDLVSKTLTEINVTDYTVDFVTESGERFRLYHNQDCCESVTLDDIVGDLNDLIGTPILIAREDINDEKRGIGSDSETWTFYNLATVKGHVTLKWYGTSNGYYSERVSFIKVEF